MASSKNTFYPRHDVIFFNCVVGRRKRLVFFSKVVLHFFKAFIYIFVGIFSVYLFDLVTVNVIL